MDNKTLLKKIKTALSSKLKVQRVYLFGSRARGIFYTDSDYDIAIVSPDFENLSFIERQHITRPLIRKVIGDEPLDVACYTPAEYERGKVGFLPQIIEQEGMAV